MTFIIAIDGPAGSGKGTIAKYIAQKLNLINIDTGAMYRCVALYVIKNNIDKSDINRIIKVLDDINIELMAEDGKQIVILNGEKVTEAIRMEEVNAIVSDIASIEEVRNRLVDYQRKLAQNKNVVMEGRDIGTVVFPNADIKVYLDAEVKVRAERRYKEYKEKNINITYEEVEKSIIQRDEKDKNRKYGALKMADDAIRIDTTNLTIEQVTQKIIELIKQSENGGK